MSHPQSKATLATILGQFPEDARSKRNLGDRFERMIQQFLRADPLYAALFSEAGKGPVGDVGIDLVAQQRGTFLC